MRQKILVELDIANESVKESICKVISSRPDFRILGWGDRELAHLLILEVDNTDPARTFETIESLPEASPDTEVFLTGNLQDPTVLLKAFEMGVKAFFPQPIEVHKVEEALTRFHSGFHQSPKSAPIKHGSLFGVIGGKGGLGTTTVAVNLALSLKELHPERSVAIIDYNFRGGELPIFLNVKPEYGFSDLSRNFPRLDSTFLMNHMTEHPSGVFLLPLGEDDISDLSVPSEEITKTFEYLTAEFDFVVVDCGHMVSPSLKPILDQASQILVVCDLNVPSIRRTKLLFESMKRWEINLEDRRKLVLVRCDGTARETITWTEDILECPASWAVPDDSELARKAINEGQPVITLAPRSKVSKVFRKMAKDLAPVPPSPSFLSRLGFSKMFPKNRINKTLVGNPTMD